MPPELSRRNFIKTTAVTAAASAFIQPTGLAQNDTGEPRPVVIASGNGLAATAKAAELIRTGADTLDAVIAGVNIVEADPKDHTVGLGGLPNEEGVVQLDSCVMHGPTHRAGAVAAIENIVHPSSVAKVVMERTDHIMLVGAGALAFAKAHGFKEQNLLTDEARQIWLRWKERLSENDDWLAPAEPANASPTPEHGTINCCAVSASGNLSGVTTTSGLAFKIPGRVGDSPIIGAGLYVDNEVGAAGSTGRGEAVIANSGSFCIVELMRQGKSPEEACLETLKRIAARTKEPRLLDDDNRPNFQVVFYAINKAGQYGSASMWSARQKRQQFAIYQAGRNRLEDTAYLYKSP